MTKIYSSCTSLRNLTNVKSLIFLLVWSFIGIFFYRVAGRRSNSPYPDNFGKRLYFSEELKKFNYPLYIQQLL